MYSKKSKDELIALCKERKIKGYSGKKKEDIIALLTPVIAESSVRPVYTYIFYIHFYVKNYGVLSVSRTIIIIEGFFRIIKS